MRTFIVEGSNWQTIVDVNEETCGPKYVDLAVEAMTTAVERFLKSRSTAVETIDINEEKSLGLILKAYEKGNENRVDYEVASLTELILRNAGYGRLAEEAKREALKAMKKQTGDS